MDYETAKQYLLSKPEAKETFPFGSEVIVFKVCHKMFATLAIEEGLARVNLKCEPNRAQALRDMFPSVLPGYHMNKVHWNTVLLDGSIPDSEIELMMDHSYERVVENLPTAERERLLG
jgi:predicted DNA-binding protein (MmcQ/YjbR family)